MVYALYCLHGTAPACDSVTRKKCVEASILGLKFGPEQQHTQVQPIRTSPDVMLALILSIQQIALLGEMGAHAASLFKRMIDQGAFLFAMHTGPKGISFIRKFIERDLASRGCGGEGHDCNDAFVRTPIDEIVRRHEELVQNETATKAELAGLISSHGFEFTHVPSTEMLARKAAKDLWQQRENASMELLRQDGEEPAVTKTALERNQSFAKRMAKKTTGSSKPESLDATEVTAPPAKAPRASKKSKGKTRSVVSVSASAGSESVEPTEPEVASIRPPSEQVAVSNRIPAGRGGTAKRKVRVEMWDDDSSVVPIAAEGVAGGADSTSYVDDLWNDVSAADNAPFSAQRGQEGAVANDETNDLFNALLFLESSSKKILTKRVRI